jgi:hypothetical protein
MLSLVVVIESPDGNDRHNGEKQGHDEANNKEDVAVRASEGEIEE